MWGSGISQVNFHGGAAIYAHSWQILQVCRLVLWCPEENTHWCYQNHPKKNLVEGICPSFYPKVFRPQSPGLGITIWMWGSIHFEEATLRLGTFANLVSWKEGPSNWFFFLMWLESFQYLYWSMLNRFCKPWEWNSEMTPSISLVFFSLKPLKDMDGGHASENSAEMVGVMQHWLQDGGLSIITHPVGPFDLTSGHSKRSKSGMCKLKWFNRRQAFHQWKAMYWEFWYGL